MSTVTEVEVVEIWGSPDEVVVLEFDPPDPLSDAQVISVDEGTSDVSLRSRVHTYVQPDVVARWIIPHGLGRRAVPLAMYNGLGTLISQWVATHPETNRMIIDVDVPTDGYIDYI